MRFVDPLEPWAVLSLVYDMNIEYCDFTCFACL